MKSSVIEDINNLSTQSCLIIAEVGLNHNGDYELAAKSVLAAAKAGANAVKFQNFVTEDFLTDRTMTYTYTSQGVEITESFFDLCKRNEFKREWIQPLTDLCNQLGIEFMSTPTSQIGVDDLVDAGCKTVKNGSDYITHIPLLRYMASSGMTVILSTGMSGIEDIDAAVETVRNAPGGVVILQCTSSYPTQPEHTNLRRMLELKKRYGLPVGFSDHTVGFQAAVQAVTLGARVIEKHFTLSHDLPGPDHWFSVTPDELSELVREIRLAELRMGSPNIDSAECEESYKNQYRIGVVAARDLFPGQILQSDDVLFRKPLAGIRPRDIEGYYGRKLLAEIRQHQTIKAEYFSS